MVLKLLTSIAYFTSLWGNLPNHIFPPFPITVFDALSNSVRLINTLYSTKSTYLRKSEGAIEHFLFETDNFELLNGKTKDERIQNHRGLTSERTYSS